jgi:hypothetical protein
VGGDLEGSQEAEEDPGSLIHLAAVSFIALTVPVERSPYLRRLARTAVRTNRGYSG